MRNTLRAILITAIAATAVGATAPLALADEFAKIVRDSKTTIQGLDCNENDVFLKPETTKAGSQIKAKIRCKYTRPDRDLLRNKDVIETRKDKSFDLTVIVEKDETEIQLTSVGPRGDVEKETLLIVIKDWEDCQDWSKGIKRKKNFFVPALDVSSISFKDSRISPISEVVLTGRLSYSRMLMADRWDLGISSYFTLVPIFKKSSDVARFVGLNLRLGYVLPWISDPWRLTLHVGYYATSMWPFNMPFGFRNMQGPQVYPTIRRTVGATGDSLSAYFKFSPVTSGLSLMSMSNNEIAGGLSYTRTLKNGHPLIFSINLSKLRLSLNAIGGTVEMQSTTSSIGFGYGL